MNKEFLNTIEFENDIETIIKDLGEPDEDITFDLNGNVVEVNVNE